jgi:hypothetical protein
MNTLAAARLSAERYVTGRELAELMGVSERTVKRMVAAGMPSETWGMSRTRRFLPSEALRWARKRNILRASPNGAPTPHRDTPTIETR